MFSDKISLADDGSSTTFKGSIFSEDDKASENTVLYSEFRLIERNEGEINVCWKGAHMMLFFMAFVFGSLCTCCFHRLMYMFDEKCVLFPKLVSHYSIHRIIAEFFTYKPQLREEEMKEPTDYVSTQWSDNSVCYLPTYVPLVSGLGGLVWTTMFLMCSSGTSNVTGSQRHWRALPFMFVFSLTMSMLCVYASVVTHSGLRELCLKLAEATGTQACSYNMNVATLVYERRIHAVYQATRLSIVTAWLHTVCWLLSTLLIIARVLLAVDFTLVHVKAQLVGNLDDILLKHEKQIDSFNAESATPIRFDIDEDDSEVELFTTPNTIKGPKKTALDLQKEPTQIPQLAQSPTSGSLPEERKILLNKYIEKILHDLLKAVGKRDQSIQADTRLNKNIPKELTDTESNEWLAKEFIQNLRGKVTQEINDFELRINSYIKNKEGNGSSEDNSKKINDGRKKHEKTDIDSENEIDNFEYGKTEQGGKVSSRNIYKINLDKGTSTKIEDKDEKDRDVSSVILNVEYYTKSYADLQGTEEITKTDKNEMKDEEIEHKEIGSKGTVNELGQLHISDDPDENNKAASIKGHDKIGKDQKKDGNTDVREHSRGANDDINGDTDVREDSRVANDDKDGNTDVREDSRGANDDKDGDTYVRVYSQGANDDKDGDTDVREDSRGANDDKDADTNVREDTRGANDDKNGDTDVREDSRGANDDKDGETDVREDSQGANADKDGDTDVRENSRGANDDKDVGKDSRGANYDKDKNKEI